MNDERMKMSVGELKEFVRNKVASLRTVVPGEEWREYYRGRLSAFEEMEGAMRGLGLFDDKGQQS